MRATRIALATLLLAWAATIVSAEPAQLPQPTGAKDDLLVASTPAPLPKWSESPDFTALRLAYARRRDFDERCEGTPGGEFEPAMAEQRFVDAAAIADRWLTRCPVDARVHQWAASAYYQAKLTEQFEQHARWHQGLCESMRAGADGLTPATAYRVISIMEEYILLQYVRLKPVRQHLLEGPQTLDAIDVTDQAGSPSTRYFDPRWHFTRMRGLLDG